LERLERLVLLVLQEVLVETLFSQQLLQLVVVVAVMVLPLHTGQE